MKNQFIIICLEDTNLDGEFPKYVQPTRKRFLTRQEAEQRMAVIADSRYPVAVEVKGMKLDDNGYPLDSQAQSWHLK
jgi:hypothetical protein